MTEPAFTRVNIKVLDDELRRLGKELARTRKAVADLITEEQVLGSVQPVESALIKKYGMNR